MLFIYLNFILFYFILFYFILFILVPMENWQTKKIWHYVPKDASYATKEGAEFKSNLHERLPITQEHRISFSTNKHLKGPQ